MADVLRAVENDAQSLAALAAADDPDRSPPRGLELEEKVIGGEPRKVPLPPLRKVV